MQSAHLPSLIQTHRCYGSGGNHSARIMRMITRAGVATIQGEDDKEPKIYYRGVTSTSDKHIVKGSEVGFKKMSANDDNVLFPLSLAHCEFLQLASRICDEVESKLELQKSKKPHRLSTTSWDLLD